MHRLSLLGQNKKASPERGLFVYGKYRRKERGGSWINPKLAPANDPESLSYPVQEKSACSMFPSQARQLIPCPYDTIRNKNLQSFRMTVCDKKGMEPRSVCRHLILRPAVSTAKNSPLSRRESENIRFTGRPASATAQAGQWLPPRTVFRTKMACNQHNRLGGGTIFAVFYTPSCFWSNAYESASSLSHFRHFRQRRSG